MIQAPTDEELVAEYVRIRRQLRDQGMLRADRSLVGEYAEYLASHRLGIRLERSLVAKAFDGTKDGIRYQIKARILRSPTSITSWDFRERPDGFDVLLAFAFDADFLPLFVIEAPLAVVQERHQRAARLAQGVLRMLERWLPSPRCGKD